MFTHGENDNDVPIVEAEQFFIALKDVGVETVMLRYPRQGMDCRKRSMSSMLWTGVSRGTTGISNTSGLRKLVDIFPATLIESVFACFTRQNRQAGRAFADPW